LKRRNGSDYDSRTCNRSILGPKYLLMGLAAALSLDKQFVAYKGLDFTQLQQPLLIKDSQEFPNPSVLQGDFLKTQAPEERETQQCEDIPF
jgi:hypothetical protein